jgi:hypothetical protein
MRVGVHHQRHPQVFRAPGVPVLQVEPVRERVDLERCSGPSRGPKDRIEIDEIRLPLPDDSPGRMGDGVDMRILNRERSGSSSGLPAD